VRVINGRRDEVAMQPSIDEAPLASNLDDTARIRGMKRKLAAAGSKPWYVSLTGENATNKLASS